MKSTRTRRRLASLAFALLAAIAAVGPAAADTGVCISGQAQETRATAVVSFRIVIPEVLGFGANAQRPHVNAPQLTKTSVIESGVRLVTIARP